MESKGKEQVIERQVTEGFDGFQDHSIEFCSLESGNFAITDYIDGWMRVYVDREEIEKLVKFLQKNLDLGAKDGCKEPDAGQSPAT